MKIYFIRHGETPWNTRARLQGKSDIPLNEKGVALAKKTGQALYHVPFSRIYTSPLERAYQTAVETAAGRDIPIVKDDRLTEISFGPWEGLSCSKDNCEVPMEQFRDFFERPFQFQPPAGGESLEEVCIRSEAFLREILQLYGETEETILVSTHGCTLRCLMYYFYKDATVNFWRGHVPPNCGVTIVSADMENFEVLEEDIVYYNENEMTDYYDPEA